MKGIRLHPHAVDRLAERGASEAEVLATVTGGESSSVKFGRTRFRRNFPYSGLWRGKMYGTKQVEAIAVDEEGWLVITVLVKFF